MTILELDYMEYANDGAAQAVYVDGGVKESVEIEQLTADNHVSIGNSGGTDYGYAQSFTLGSEITISKVSLDFDTTVGSPSGQVTVKIETDDGGEPSGILADANATKDITPVASDWNDVEFASPFTLPSGYYWIVIVCDTQSTDNKWQVHRILEDSPYEGGSIMRTIDGEENWTDVYTGSDLTFKVYKIIVPLQCYSEDTIKQQGDYSLKIIALQTESLNETLTKTGLSIDLSDRTSLKLYVRADRTGPNLQARLYDSVGGWITKDVNVTSTGSFIEIDVDISGVSNADKSDITKIEFKILNADSPTIYYIDNFYAPIVIVGNAVLFGINF